MKMNYTDTEKQQAAIGFLEYNGSAFDWCRSHIPSSSTVLVDWIRAEYKRVNDLLTDARDAKNKALDIINQKDIKRDKLQSRIDTFQRILNTLGEFGIYSDEGLAEYFKIRNEEIYRLKLEINRINKHAESREKEIRRLEGIASGQPPTTILNLQEELHDKEIDIDQMRKSNKRFEHQVSDLAAKKLQLQIRVNELESEKEKYSYSGMLDSAIQMLEDNRIENDTHLINHFKEFEKLQLENKNLQETIKEKDLLRRFNEINNIHCKNLELNNDIKQLKNTNEGLHLLINDQDDKQRDAELIAKMQVIVDAAEDLRQYLGVK